VRKLGWLSVIVALCVVAAACGSRKSDTSSGGDSSNTTAGSSLATGQFGDVTGVCGPGTANGATATGVTDTDIRVGTIADPGYTGLPGLDQEFFDTAKAFSEWCNAAGGIQGRKIKVDYLDAKLFEYKDRITEACAQDFSLVGGGGVFDDTGAQDRVDCGLPDFAGFVVNPQAAEADLMIQSIPNPIKAQQMGQYQALVKQNPDLKNAVGIITSSFAATKVTADKYKEAFDQLGATTVYQGEYAPTGEANWAPFASAMKDAGVKTLAWVGSYPNLTALQKAMNDQNWFPEVTIADASHYDQGYATIGASTAKNTYVPLYFYPFEEKDKHPAVQQYLDILDASGPKAKATLLGMQAWSSWMMFAKSAAACGSNLTRDCLMTEGFKINSWTGGGLHTQTNPAAGTMPDCIGRSQSNTGGP